MLAQQTYVCDYCNKLYPDKRLLIEIEFGLISQNGCKSSFSNQTVHLCSTHNKCIVGYAKAINQKEVR